MQKITRFYVGLSDKKMENQVVHPDEVIEKSKQEFEGFTIYESKGGWKGKTENSMVVEVVGLSDEKVERVKKEMAEEFNQDSVMVVQQQAEVMF